MDKSEQDFIDKINKKILQFMNLKDFKLNKKYTSNTHFENIRYCPYLTKIIILGEVGLGKSSLANKMSGTHYIQSINTQKKKYGNLYPKIKEELFESGSSANSITKRTSFVLTHYLGLKNQKIIMLIDTPGFFDPEQAFDDELEQDEGRFENENFCK